MSASRPAVPAALERRLKEEAGYRCAVPRCGGTVRLEMAHIEPWAKVEKHEFENMICLCGDCHWRYDKLKQIPKKSILAFKANLAVVNGRYGDFERRVLEYFAEQENLLNSALKLPFHQDIHLRNLIRDQLLVKVHSERHILSGHFEDGIEIYTLTLEGASFVERWVSAQNIS